MKSRMAIDLVIINANIWTLESKKREEALAVLDDMIIKVGSNEEIKELITDETIVIDAKGNTVLPGFIDAHTHIIWTGLNKIYVDLENTKSIEEAVTLLKQEADKKGPDKWVIGRNWDQSKWVEQRYITAQDLDKKITNNPVFLRHVSGHLSTVNTLGYKRLRIDDNTHGVDKDENGAVVGILRDIELDDNEELLPTAEDILNGLNLGMEEALKLGITSIHDNIIYETWPAYKYLKQNNQLKVRIYGIIYQTMLEEATKLGLTRNYEDKWFKVGAVKLMTDGALSSRTAYLFDDYIDKEGEKGFSLYDDQKLDYMVKAVHDSGLQLAIHAIGDKAIAKVVDSIQRMINKEECKTALHRIEHAELVRKEDVERVKDWNIVFSMQPNFVWRWGMVDVDGMYEKKLGRERTLLNNPFKWVTDNDLHLVFGSDGMPLGPLYGIKGVIFHPNPDLRLGLEEAIYHYTYTPAVVSGEDKIKGSLKPGKLADIIILNRNLDQIDLESFHDVDINYTIVAGSVAYKREEN